MMKFMIIIFLSLVTLTSSSIKKSFTLKLFFDLEKIKCYNNRIDGYLLQTELFESKGQRNGVKTFITYSNVRDVVTINTYDYRKGYYLATTSSDIYNYIKKNGTYFNTESDSQGKVNLAYSYNNKLYWISKEEPFSGGRIYYISSDDCE